MSQIHELILLAKGEVVAIPKAGKVPCGGASYAYRKIDDVVNKVCPIFDRHKIVTTMNCSDITSSQQVEEKKHARCCDRNSLQSIVSCAKLPSRSLPPMDRRSSAAASVKAFVLATERQRRRRWPRAGSMPSQPDLGFRLTSKTTNKTAKRPKSHRQTNRKTPSLSQMLSGEPTATTTATASEPTREPMRWKST